MQIPSSKTLCEKNIDTLFKGLGELNGEQKTILYLMALRKYASKLKNPNIKSWICRETAGFIKFPEELISASNDEELQK